VSSEVPDFAAKRDFSLSFELLCGAHPSGDYGLSCFNQAVSLKLIICASSRSAPAQERVLSRVLVALQKPQPFESTFNGAEGASVFSCDGRYGLAFGEFDLELLFFLLAPFFAYALG
jgi:hypothetical protein